MNDAELAAENILFHKCFECVPEHLGQLFLAGARWEANRAETRALVKEIQFTHLRDHYSYFSVDGCKYEVCRVLETYNAAHKETQGG